MGNDKIRYAVVGLGHIAQAAVLPAFRHVTDNSELVALVSSDRSKLHELGDLYGVSGRWSYDELEQCFEQDRVDAVYICLPNDMHHEFTLRAAEQGVHVLCEKPLAVTARECREMIEACEENDVKLMTAYRLHFEETNLRAIELVRSGRIGEPKTFSSVFSQQVKGNNIRVKRERGGGTLYDIGIYCINAARYLFREEPIEVFAVSTSSGDRRFEEVDETTSAILQFREGRIASFVTSFGMSDTDSYRIVGTKGDLRVEPAFTYHSDLEHYLTVDGKRERRTFPQRDQFAPEIHYFSKCILEDLHPEPSGLEGLIDVRIVQALYQSSEERRPVSLAEIPSKPSRPSMELERRYPPVKMPETVKAESPSRQ